MENTMWEIEDQNYEAGFKVICGVDEAGRGPLAGPVYAAAVILPPHAQIPGLNDSKKLSDKRRRELFPMICQQAQAILSIIYSPDDFNSAPTGCCINDWLYLVLHYSNHANTLAFSFVVFIIVLFRLLMRISSSFTESITELTKCVNRKNNWKV